MIVSLKKIDFRLVLEMQRVMRECATYVNALFLTCLKLYRYKEWKAPLNSNAILRWAGMYTQANFALGQGDPSNYKDASTKTFSSKKKEKEEIYDV